MKPFFSMLLMLAVCAVAVAQEGCPEYGRLIREAADYSGRGYYREALYKFNSAKTCSPGRRREVDSMINLLFVKIEGERKKAQAAENRFRDTLNMLHEYRFRVRSMELAKNAEDSLNLTQAFVADNKDWYESLPEDDARMVLQDVTFFNRAGKGLVVDSLSTFFRTLYDGKLYVSDYVNETDTNRMFIGMDKFPTDARGDAYFFRFRGLEFAYNAALERIDQAEQLLPVTTGQTYKSRTSEAYQSLALARVKGMSGYWMPDTLIGLPEATMYTITAADNKNIMWGYTDFADFRKIRMRVLNLSIPDFTLTTDSLIDLADSGRYYTVYASTGNYHSFVGRAVDYALKPNKVAYKKQDYATPLVKRVMDDRGAVLADLSGDSSTAYFFTPDGSRVASWTGDSHLQLFDTRKKNYIPLANAERAPTMSFAGDSRSIAYYNPGTRTIYFAGLDGQPLGQIPGAATRISEISNIDYTGGDAFLIVNNEDTISLFDLRNRKPVLTFDKSFVSGIVVSPNKKDILVTFSTVYRNSTDTFYGTTAVLIDSELNIKTRLYSGSGRYFFTPDGEYIIGIGDRAISRWTVNPAKRPAPMPTCVSFDELVENKYFSLPFLKASDDAARIQSGAYALKDMAADQKDIRLKMLLFRQAQSLFDRLKYGNAKNIRKERVPTYYDWYNWIDRKLGNRNFGEQFLREQIAVKLEEDLMNSPDSIYPQQVDNAAYGYTLMANLYDSLGAFNKDFVGQVSKEINLRHRLFWMDPDNTDNIDYYTYAVKRISNVCDSVGWLQLQNGQYADRLEMYRQESALLGERWTGLPDSIGVKVQYIDALTQLGTSYLYVYVNRPADYALALDSAIYIADKGLAFMPDRYDSARLLVVKARALLLKPGELERALAIYREVKGWSDGFPTESMLKQLDYLKMAGARKEEEFRRVEELLKQ